MTTEINKTYDIFLSHAPQDAALAAEIASACRTNGLEVFTGFELPPGTDLSDAVWEAIAESRVLLTILSASGLTPSMAIEVGAARAWNKPIFAVVTDPSSTQIPPALSGIQLYTIGRLQEVIDAARSSGQQLSDEDRVHLAALYAELGIAVDQFAINAGALEGLVDRFRRDRGKIVSGERLMSELLRLRKQGKLPKISVQRLTKSRTTPA
jgi:hypothetical protein